MATATWQYENDKITFQDDAQVDVVVILFSGKCIALANPFNLA